LLEEMIPQNFMTNNKVLFKYKWLRAAIIEKIEKYLKGNK
jgi:hypothetical protein